MIFNDILSGLCLEIWLQLFEHHPEASQTALIITFSSPLHTNHKSELNLASSFSLPHSSYSSWWYFTLLVATMLVFPVRQEEVTERATVSHTLPLLLEDTLPF